jgi:hypothetical protein
MIIISDMLIEYHNHYHLSDHFKLTNTMSAIVKEIKRKEETSKPDAILCHIQSTDVWS